MSEYSETFIWGVVPLLSSVTRTDVRELFYRVRARGEYTQHSTRVMEAFIKGSPYLHLDHGWGVLGGRKNKRLVYCDEISGKFCRGSWCKIEEGIEALLDRGWHREAWKETRCDNEWGESPSLYERGISAQVDQLRERSLCSLS